MNQKGHKAIAEIIKKIFGNSVAWQMIKNKLSNALADYFEQEDIALQEAETREDVFDRKQFKEWCGVSE